MNVSIYMGLIGLMSIFHALRIIRLRIKNKIGIGTGGNIELERRVRIFGNLVEHAPLALILLFAMEYLKADSLLIHYLGISLILGRILHAMAINKSTGRSVFRVFGMILTFQTIFVSSIYLIFFGTKFY